MINDEGESVYCKKCGGCGHSGCCKGCSECGYHQMRERIEFLEEELDKFTDVIEKITKYINNKISCSGYIDGGGDEYIKYK